MAAERDTRRGGASETETSDDIGGGRFVESRGFQGKKKDESTTGFSNGNQIRRVEKSPEFAIPLGGVRMISEESEPSLPVKGSKNEQRWRCREALIGKSVCLFFVLGFDGSEEQCSSASDRETFFRSKREEKTIFLFLSPGKNFFLGGRHQQRQRSSNMAPLPVELPRLRMRHALLEAAPELAELLGGESNNTVVGGGASRRNDGSAAASVALRSPSPSSSPQRKQQLLNHRSSFDAENTEEEQVVREKERGKRKRASVKKEGVAPERLFVFFFVF